VISEDIAPPPRERLGTYDVHATREPRCLQFGLYTPAFGSKQRCWVVHAGVGFEMSVLVVHAGARLKTSVLGRIRRHRIRVLAIVSCSRWLSAMGRPYFVLSLCSCFDVLWTPTSLDNDKGRGDVQGGVGCPHSQRLSWPAFWSIWHSGWFSRFLASIRIRVVVLTALGVCPGRFHGPGWRSLTWVTR
jgi:hypothetical protein